MNLEKQKQGFIINDFTVCVDNMYEYISVCFMIILVLCFQNSTVVYFFYYFLLLSLRDWKKKTYCAQEEESLLSLLINIIDCFTYHATISVTYSLVSVFALH